MKTGGVEWEVKDIEASHRPSTSELGILAMVLMESAQQFGQWSAVRRGCRVLFTGEDLQQERRVGYSGAVAVSGPGCVWKLGVPSAHDLCRISVCYDP